MSFSLTKMTTVYGPTVQYSLASANNEKIEFNKALGKKIKLSTTGVILCVNCGKKTKKSFGEGYCYPCLMKLASCDICQTSPEKCHFAKGTCREPAWAELNCFIPHTVYLSNTSGLKVGITRTRHEKHRWMDQGATQALAVMEVKDRLSSGEVEVALKENYADKTNYRAMLSGSAENKDLLSLRAEILAKYQGPEWKPRTDAEIKISYPVLEYPKKIISLNLEKTPVLEGRLLGIKAQYLILDSGVINIRKWAGYQADWEVLD